MCAVTIGSADDHSADPALGDWYVNRFVVDRQPLLLLVSSRSLLSILEPARHVRQLPDRLPGLVGQRLRRLGVADPLIEREIAVMHPVVVGPTRDRSVVGTLVDFERTARARRSVPDISGSLHILYRSTRKPDGIAGAAPAARVFLESPALDQIEDVAIGCVL